MSFRLRWQALPGWRVGCRWVVGDCNAAALQFKGADAGIVVGQRSSHRLAPRLAPVEGLAAVDAVGLAVAHESHQMARLKLYDIGMDMTIALRHHDHMPGLALVVRNAESSGVAGQALSRVGAEPVGEDPAAIAQHLNGLAAESALLGEDRLIGPHVLPPSVLFWQRTTAVYCILSLPACRSSCAVYIAHTALSGP